jgi:hypothetical protein
MALISGQILVGGLSWLRSRTAGVVIAERNSRLFPRYAPPAPGAAPYNPSATTHPTTRGGVQLAWANGVSSNAQTEILYSPDNVTWYSLTTVPLTTTSYVDVYSPTRTLRYYKFRHVNVTDVSPSTAVVSATNQADYPAGAPTTLVATTPGTRPAGETTANLTWVNGDASAGVTTLLYYRIAGASTWTLHGSVGAGVAAYAATGLTPNQSYNFKAVHQKDTVNSADSNIAGATTLVDGPDAPPTGLTATQGTGVPGQGTIALAWTNGDTSAQTDIYYSTDGTTYTFYRTVNPGVASNVFSENAYDVLRYFKVVHVKNALSSAFSNIASAHTGLDIPEAPPSNLMVAVPARPTGETQLSLSWVNGDVTAQTRVYRDGVLVQTVGAGTAGWADTGRPSNTLYSYEVRHVKSGVESAGSTASARTLVDGPDGDPQSVTFTNGQPVGTVVTPGASGFGTISWANTYDTSCAVEVWTNLNDGNGLQLRTTTSPGATSQSNVTFPWNSSCTFAVRYTKNGVPSSFVYGTAVLPPIPATLPTVSASGGRLSDGQLGVALTFGNLDYNSTLDIEEYSGGTWNRLATGSTPATSYEVKPRTAGSVFQYRVRQSRSGYPTAWVTTGNIGVPDAPPNIDAAFLGVVGYRDDQYDDSFNLYRQLWYWNEFVTVLFAQNDRADTSVEFSRTPNSGGVTANVTALSGAIGALEAQLLYKEWRSAWGYTLTYAPNYYAGGGVSALQVRLKRTVTDPVTSQAVTLYSPWAPVALGGNWDGFASPQAPDHKGPLLSGTMSSGVAGGVVFHGVSAIAGGYQVSFDSAGPSGAMVEVWFAQYTGSGPVQYKKVTEVAANSGAQTVSTTNISGSPGLTQVNFLLRFRNADGSYGGGSMYAWAIGPNPSNQFTNYSHI